MERIFKIVIAAVMWIIPGICLESAYAQEFSVGSFGALPGDLSGALEQVADLNGDPCALIKVVAPKEFVFSSPLGIVKRVDRTGEIWLYLPQGSKKITLKHPRLGVLRDYTFTEPLKGKMTYELRLDLPQQPERTGMARDTVFTTLRDTLVVVRTDTLRLPDVRKSVPMKLHILPAVGFGSSALTLSGGMMAVALKRHGGFLHFSTDFGRSVTTDGECDRHGYIDGTLPFYTGRKRHMFYLVTAGAAHRLSDSFILFEGLGYGSNTIAWEIVGKEGNEFVKNKALSHHGVSAEAGAVYTRRRFSVSASVATVGGKQWYGFIGIGINIGK